MATLHALSHPHWATRSGVFPCVGDHDGIGCTVADAVLAAVEPVIRRQVAEEIAAKIEAAPIPGESREYGHTGRRWFSRAAAIARSHSTREEQDHA